MNRKSPASNMQENLRAVVGRFESVAALCRATGINRQQFNKYLAGLHAPSSRTIAKLSEHFQLSPSDFVLAPAAFKERLSPKSAAPSPGDTPAHFRQLADLAANSAAQLKPFLGTYFRYHHSSIYSGKIVRAVTVIFRSTNTVEYVTVERFPLQEGEGKGHYSFFYTGMCYMLGNRVFLVDFERRQRNEMTMAILMPQHRTPMKYLYGLLSGVASSTFRQPFSSRVVLERRSDDTSIRKEKLRLATVMDPGSPDISPSVSRFFDSDENKLIFGHE